MDQQISSKDSRGRAAGFKSISEHAGVSPSTVDRVLNERGGVSRSARAKVLAAARELGVKRILPPAINGIVQVNLVVPNLGDFYVGRWSNAVNQAARQLGANVRIELLNWSRRDDRLLNHALVSSKRNARFPLIVVSAADDVLSSAVKHKALKNVPTFVIDGNAGDSASTQRAGMDHRKAGRLAADIALCATPPQGDITILQPATMLSLHDDRKAGFLEKLGESKNRYRIHELKIRNEAADAHRVAEGIHRLKPNAIYSLLPGNTSISQALRFFPAGDLPRWIVHDCTHDHLRLLSDGTVSTIVESPIDSYARYALSSVLNGLGEDFALHRPDSSSKAVFRENMPPFVQLQHCP